MVTQLHLHCARILIKGYTNQPIHSSGKTDGGPKTGEPGASLVEEDLVIESPMPVNFCRTIEMVPGWWDGPPPKPRLTQKLQFRKRYGTIKIRKQPLRRS